MIAEMIIDMKR